MFFSCFMKWNWRPLILKSWHFEAHEDIITKLKSQYLHVIRIKYWKAGGIGNPPSLIPVLWNIQATRTKHFDGQCKIGDLKQISLVFRVINPWLSGNMATVVEHHFMVYKIDFYQLFKEIFKWRNAELTNICAHFLAKNEFEQ